MSIKCRNMVTNWSETTYRYLLKKRVDAIYSLRKKIPSEMEASCYSEVKNLEKRSALQYKVHNTQYIVWLIITQ